MSLLYLEAIFPLFFVEQKRGWGGIQSQTPTYLRIRDVGRRSVEFVLALSGGDMAARRQLLQERIAAARQQWSRAVAAFRFGADENGIVVRGVPGQPVTQWPIKPRPSLWVAIRGTQDEWQPLDDEIRRLTTQLGELNQRLLPRADDAAPEVSAELQASLQELREVSDIADTLHRELSIEDDQVRSLESRIASLEDDMRRSQDAEALRRMGAPLNAVTPEDCPTCHQELPSTLLDPASGIVAMPIERNIKLLKEQIDLFRAMRSDLDAAIAAKRNQLVSFDERVRALQQSVRAQRETLVSASGAPSITDVETRVHLRDQVEVLTNVVGRLASLNSELARLAQTWSGLMTEQARLREQGTPDADRVKIAAFQASFMDQLGSYGFTSLPISELTMSEDTYQPVYEGYDLGFDLSASDMVRTIWSHRIGLLEVARRFESRHAQLLVFDEPRQQSTDPLSFFALFRRAGQAARYGQQLIFATSEPEASLQAMLQGVDHRYLGFDGKMIRRQEQ
jgi:predicted  nucleic acid-binding Zn-ribbon protein